MNTEEMKPTGSPSSSVEHSKTEPNQKNISDLNSKIENVDDTEKRQSTSNKSAGESLNFDRLNFDKANFDKVVGDAREQMNKAADAFSRGDFLQDEALDPGASGDDRLVAALCYFVPGLMSVLVIFSDSGSKRPFQRYHAVQSLGLSAALVAVSIAYTVISAIAWAVPIIGWLVGVVLFCLAPIAFLMAVIAYLYYGYQAYLGKRFAIPGLTGYLRDQGWI